MPISTPTFKPGDVSVTGATNVEITNLSLPTANTEVSHSLQSGLKELRIRARGIAKLQYAFVSTESGTKYWTIPIGATDNITDSPMN